MLKSPITINSRKFDNQIHRSWKANLLKETSELFVLVGKFEKEILHPLLGIIRRNTVSYEFYWKNRWYNVFRFHEPGGELRNFYCNINQPPTLTNNTLDYIDLDIDVLVWKDFSYEVVDFEEFEENARRFSYSPDLHKQVNKSLEELLKMIEQKSFPFDYKF